MAFQSKSSFIDSRFDSFEHLGVMRDYRSIMMAFNAYELMDKYRVDHALLKDDLPITYLLEKTPGWQVVMHEKAWQGEYLLFAKTGDSSISPGCVPAPPARAR